jgi:hypothetical protein
LQGYKPLQNTETCEGKTRFGLWIPPPLHAHTANLKAKIVLQIEMHYSKKNRIANQGLGYKKEVCKPRFGLQKFYYH